MSDKELNTEEVAKMADITVQSVRVWLRNGTLKSIKRAYGKSHRYTVLESVLKEFLENRNKIIE